MVAINHKLLYPEEMAELGEVIQGKRPGRMSDQQITFFKSVGVAVQDAIAAQLALENAETMGLGQYCRNLITIRTAKYDFKLKC